MPRTSYDGVDTDLFLVGKPTDRDLKISIGGWTCSAAPGATSSPKGA